MSATTTRRLAALIWGVCVALAAGTLVLLVLGAGEHTVADGSTFDGSAGLSFVAASLAFATVGAMVAARVPDNPIGWIFCVTGVALGVANFGNQYAEQMLFVASDPLPGGRTAAVFQQLGLAPSFGLLALALLLFPDGRSPSGRWRVVLWLALAGIGLSVVGTALRPGPLVEPFDSVSNPFGIPGLLGLMDAFLGFGFVFTLPSVVLAGFAMRARLRRSRGLEREQLKWLVLAAAVTGVAVVGTLVLYLAAGIDVGGEYVLGLGFSTFPLAAGAAILRYRIYDIDVVINRTLVYACAHGDARARLPRQRAPAPARIERRHRGLGARGRGLHARGGGAVPPGPYAHPGGGRPALLPAQVRRRPNARRVLARGCATRSTSTRSAASYGGS